MDWPTEYVEYKDLYAEDNNGADFIDIHVLDDGRLEVKVGRACVYILCARMRPSVLAAIIERGYNVPVEEIVDYDDEEFNKELVDSFELVRSYN